jgi:ribosomal protein S18 acetylase RimI-like enzyme
MAEHADTMVSTLYPESYRDAAHALGRAFINDPLFTAIDPDVSDPTARAKRLADVFIAMLVIEKRHGQPTFGIFADGKVAGAAITEGVSHPGTFAALATGLFQLPRMVRAIGWPGIRRSIEVFNILAQNHPREPHLYLQVLGVDPDFQKRHYGVALLEHLRAMAQARADIAGVYLETATESNVAYYSARGYEVIGELRPLGVRVWRMFQRCRPKGALLFAR